MSNTLTKKKLPVLSYRELKDSDTIARLDYESYIYKLTNFKFADYFQVLGQIFRAKFIEKYVDSWKYYEKENVLTGEYTDLNREYIVIFWLNSNSIAKYRVEPKLKIIYDQYQEAKKKTEAEAKTKQAKLPPFQSRIEEINQYTVLANPLFETMKIDTFEEFVWMCKLFDIKLNWR